jgi:uncharacterized BrkB/YihY/UPF0761 family membrane protein
MLALVMDDQQPTTPTGPIEDAPERKGPWRLVLRTASKAWKGNIFSEAAEAAFWQTLSLPPLLLGLLGSLGYLGDWFGPQIVLAVQEKIIGFCRTVFSTNVVETIIQPTVSDILTRSHSEIASFGFLLSLWAGSSAMSSFVDAITVAYQQYGVRNEVIQRLFALLLYLIGLILAVIGLPVLALGPNFLPKVFPEAWQPTVASIGNVFYYPVVAVLLVIALATLYKVALPRRYPCWPASASGSTCCGSARPATPTARWPRPSRSCCSPSSSAWPSSSAPTSTARSRRCGPPSRRGGRGAGGGGWRWCGQPKAPRTRKRTTRTIRPTLIRRRPVTRSGSLAGREPFEDPFAVRAHRRTGLG